jgi:hypothetical protein
MTFQATMLSKRKMVTYFSCLDLAEHANKQEWDGEITSNTKKFIKHNNNHNNENIIIKI